MSNARKQTAAVTDVIAERRRQIEKEGFAEMHDDEHTDGSCAAAAACYAMHYVQRSWSYAADKSGYRCEQAPDEWPESWGEDWWKPKDPRRDLVRAAALLIAEIERIDRSGAK